MAAGAFTTLDPKDTYLGILSLGKDNDVLHATNVTAIQDSAGNASLLELSQDKVDIAGVMSASVATGIVMDTGILFTSDEVITDKITMLSDTDVGIFFVTATPEGSITASIGSIALRNTGSAGTTLYVKESGTGNTGWVAQTVTDEFADLSDCPAITASYYLRGNAGGTALEFIETPDMSLLDLNDGPAGYDDGKFLMSGVAGFTLEDIPSVAFLDLSDCAEPNYTSDKHALVKVNAAENGLAFDAADPDQGDILYFNGSNWTKLPPDTSGKVLITQGVGANPKWDVASAGGSNDPDAVHVDVAAEINGLSTKATPAAGDVLIIEDVADSYAKKKVAMSTLLGNDANAIHDNISGEITAVTEKATPHDDDVVLIEDSEAANVKKRVKLSNIGGGGSATDVPHLGTTPAELTASILPTLLVYAGDSDASEVGYISALDIIKATYGGVASPSWSYTLTCSSLASSPATNADPALCVLEVDLAVDGLFEDWDNATVQVYVEITDGTNTIGGDGSGGSANTMVCGVTITGNGPDPVGP